MGKRKTKPSEIIFLVEEAPDGGYTAHALGEAIFTQAETMPLLKKNVLEAVHCHFSADQLPKMVRLHVVHDELIAV